MDNYRAGLYSFASTTTWLHEIGVASPPLLVMLGLTLPDSRILSGIASIGLTLANIANILPHLRQPMLDSLHAPEATLAHEPSTQEHMKVFPGRSNVAYLVDLFMESPVITPGSSLENQHQSPRPTCSSTIKSLCFANTEVLGRPNVEFEAATQTIPLPVAEAMDVREIPPQIPPSTFAGSSEKHLSPSNLFSREGRGAHYIPLPIPDAEEVAFFDTKAATSYSDPEDYEQHITSEAYSAIEDYGTTAEEAGHIVTAEPSSTQEHLELGWNTSDIALPVTEEKVTHPSTIPDYHNLSAGGSVSEPLHSISTRRIAIQSAQATDTSIGGNEARCAESLVFIPQSVIRRYPLVPTVWAGRGFGHQAFNPGHNYQVPLPAPQLILVHNPAMLLEETRPRAAYTTLQGHWDASFLTRVQPTRRWIGSRTETGPAQDLLKQGPRRESRTPKRRLGVLARAALCNRRSTARRCKYDEDAESSTSGSDLEFDNTSQYSSGSSTYESMLPHMLGADLIAAIDANSDPGLSPVGSKRSCTSLNVYEDYPISDDSEADVSMVMRISSEDDASDGEVGVPATSRPLTYEDIQQWASGVIQKCVGQVCRSNVGEPSSSSQASDICAERPSGPGMSRCPLAGLHCKIGAAALTETLAPRTRELQVPPLLTYSLSNRKPLEVRNWSDIPEFIPRQRQASTITGRVEVPRKHDTRSAMDVTRDAAAQVIARMENQARFNTRQWLVDTEEKRMVTTAGGQLATLRCA